MQQQTPRIVIFGSTGGCGLSALNECLNAGYDVTVLVRSKDKLLQLLHKSHNINNQINNNHISKNDHTYEPPANLSIVQGDIREVDKVKEVIENRDVIISGIGMYLNGLYFVSFPISSLFSLSFIFTNGGDIGSMITFNSLRPSLIDRNICYDAISIIISAISQVRVSIHSLLL